MSRQPKAYDAIDFSISLFEVQLNEVVHSARLGVPLTVEGTDTAYLDNQKVGSASYTISTDGKDVKGKKGKKDIRLTVKVKGAAYAGDYLHKVHDMGFKLPATTRWSFTLREVFCFHID